MTEPLTESALINPAVLSSDLWRPDSGMAGASIGRPGPPKKN
jgi:hypothetical protein